MTSALCFYNFYSMTSVPIRRQHNADTVSVDVSVRFVFPEYALVVFYYIIIKIVQ